MEQRASQAAALAGMRVLDLSTNHAAYAGRLLADLGADVLRIEPPEGSPVRRLAPLQTVPDGETFSFAQAFLDAGKRSITLDLAAAADRARFAELAAGSDVDHRDAGLRRCRRSGERTSTPPANATPA